MPALSDRLLMKLKSTSSRIQAGALLAPGLLIFCCFTIYPIVKLFLMSFTDWTLASMVSQNFTGLSNYEEVFSDPVFFTTFANTLLYTLITVPGQMAAGLFVAYLINGIDRGSVFFRVINYLPVITSWVIASLVFRYCFNTEGLLNYFLVEKLGMADQNIRWLDQRWTALAVAMLLGIWKGVGWNMVVFLAALQQVPKELYEAAEMDGCGYIKKFTKITLPEIRGTILFAWVMLTIAMLFVCAADIVSGNASAYYCRYYLQDDTLIGTLSAISNVCKVAGMILVVPIMLKKLGKRNSLMIAAALIVAANLSRTLAPYSVELNYVISAICGFGSGFTYTCLFAMIPDCVEYSEYRDYERHEGLVYSSVSFASKVAGGLGVLVSSFVMNFGGYVNGAESQSEQAMNAILAAHTIIPPIMFIVAIVALSCYKLDKIYDDVIRELKLRHLKDETAAEAKA